MLEAYWQKSDLLQLVNALLHNQDPASSVPADVWLMYVHGFQTIALFPTTQNISISKQQMKHFR